MSSPAVQLHSTLPEASSDSYSPFQTVDFLIMAPGRKLMKNSIRIEGDIRCVKDANAWTGTGFVDYDSNVKIDNAVGAHAFFDSFTTETQSKGVLETLANYPRYISAHARATLAEDDLLSSKYVSEARGPTEANGNFVLQPVADQAFVTGQTEQADQRTVPSFSCKPMVAFNRQAGGDYSFDSNGFIRVSCILAANNHALFGGAGTATYTLENLNCRFTTIPDDGQQEPMMMRSYVNVVSSVQSTATTIAARVPSESVNSVTMTFAKQTHLQSQEYNSYALESLPKFDNVSYLFANSLQNYVTYVVREDSDALSKGLESMESAGHSEVSAKTLKANKGSIYGLSFDEYVDLSKQKFTIQLKVDGASITAEPMDCFLYFNSLLTM
jgi:hypothetical protein